MLEQPLPSLVEPFARAAARTGSDELAFLADALSALPDPKGIDAETAQRLADVHGSDEPNSIEPVGNDECAAVREGKRAVAEQREQRQQVEPLDHRVREAFDIPPPLCRVVVRRVVEHREVARIVDDVGGVAIAPLDTDGARVLQHRIAPPSIPGSRER